MIMTMSRSRKAATTTVHHMVLKNPAETTNKAGRSINSVHQSATVKCLFLFKDGAYLYRSIFAQFMTMQEKQILARAVEIQKENWG